ncbi:hypothetical protein ISF_01505 [Cordyceps fumosorosea ARSEF 2679]|uniref:ASX DEUBAD domain-containing protein n=1 Tax=Cordyceps fumosorosea (strain ARSEF 2679) TaxID=1081104 RepID=A0A162JQT6_CORFA|nr:hypothetical protein ISF_01505 [Cordyceps fumosorosea ARSEF 2679]OAA72432.1 hypothetical protein ISF_01505 [Cordyceps fumosorosea ARSEF 2679]
MADQGNQSMPVEDGIQVDAADGEAHAKQTNASTTEEANPQDADKGGTTLVSRPRRSLRNAGRITEETVVKRTVRIISKRKWDAERLLTDPKSPLARANLRTILSNPIAWSSLDAVDHAEILALFPDQRHVVLGEDGTAQPNTASLMNDDSFRYDCAAYTESLAQGRHDPDWLAQAWAAHERRRAGDFKDYLRAKFEKDWEVQLPEEREADASKEALAGDAATQVSSSTGQGLQPHGAHVSQ